MFPMPCRRRAQTVSLLAGLQTQGSSWNGAKRLRTHLRNDDKVRGDEWEYEFTSNAQREAVNPEEGDDGGAVESGRVEVADGACDDHADDKTEHGAHVLGNRRSEDVDDELEGVERAEGGGKEGRESSEDVSTDTQTCWGFRDVQ